MPLKEQVGIMLNRDRISTGSSPLLDKLNKFMRTPGYIVLIAILTALSNTKSLEIPVFTAFAAIAAYVCFFGDDLLPLTPLFAYAYATVSLGNNPGKNPTGLLSAAGSGVYIIGLAAVIIISLLYRIIRDRRSYLQRKYVLLSGMLILTLAYMLGGIGSLDYSKHALQSIIYAALNGAAIIIPYVLLSGGIRWENARKDYLIWVGFCLGCLLLWEIAWIYLTGNVIQEGVINRSQIYTGWGMYNNIGSLLAMTIPFPFYLATKYRKGWIGVLAGSVFLVGVLLTCSRTSIFCGCAIYFLCVLLMLLYSKDWKANIFTLVFFTTAMVLALYFFGEDILALFSSLLDHGFDPSNRDSIYKDGIALFSKYPVLGGSFFNKEYVPWAWSTNSAFNSLIPPRWHNTYVQLLASCGAVGMGAYIIHRFQTAKLFLKKITPEKSFIACSIIVLLATSLFDCHFFNIGPVLLYSVSLAFAENLKD